MVEQPPFDSLWHWVAFGFFFFGLMTGVTLSNVSDTRHLFSSTTSMFAITTTTTDNPLQVVSNILTFATPIVARDAARIDPTSGYLAAASSANIHKFSLDVGFNKGKVTVNDWLEHQPQHFVLAVEAIPALFTLFETMMSSETQIGDLGTGAGEGDTTVPYWKLTKFHGNVCC